MNLDTATLLRIFLGEEERHASKPLSMAIVDAARAAGFRGATVLKGIEGFGRSGRLRTSRAADAGSSLPVLIEIVEAEAEIAAFLPIVREMIGHGLLTLERIEFARGGDPSRGESA